MAVRPVSDSRLTLSSAQETSITKSPSWWYGRSRSERALCLVSITSVLACLGLAISLAVILISYERALSTEQHLSVAEELQSMLLPADKNVCLTKGCVKAAANLIDNMDFDTDPCHDFYQFSCGGYVERTVIPEDKTGFNMFSMLADQLKAKLKNLIEQQKETGEPESFWKVKDLFTACMNTTLIDIASGDPLKSLLQRLGGWPVLVGKEEWDEESFDWQKLIYAFRREGVSVDYLFDISIVPDLKHTTVRTIELDQPDFGMPDRAYLLKGLQDPLVQAYYNYMVSVAVLLGAQRDDAEEQLKESLQLEIALANFSLPKEERRNFTKLYNMMKISDLSNITNEVSWLQYLNMLLLDNLTEDEPIVVNVPSYLTNAMNFISNTPKRVIANYMFWRATMSSITHLDKHFRSLRLDYTSKLTGQTKEEARWTHCMDVATTALPNVMGSLYVRKYFKNSAKEAAVEMVLAIRDEFKKILTEIDWMDKVTLKRAHEKLLGMKEHIAYPDELLDNRKLDRLYKNLSLNNDNHFNNIMEIKKFATNYAFGLLRKPVNKTDWVHHGDAAVVNAYYNPPENSILFPAGILQGVFFDSDRPRYLNFGGIGFVIGHEITHGFDDQGRQFDVDGNLNSWWQSETDNMFQEKVQCIIHQYGNFTVPENGLNVNGINTQGENVADNGGLKEAYRAYTRWIQANGPEPYLPGLDLSPRQLFWISAANIWCNKERPETLKLRVMTGYHSPSRFRVNGPMSNQPEFSEDFNCPLGTDMNPKHKCSVW